MYFLILLGFCGKQQQHDLQPERGKTIPSVRLQQGVQIVNMEPTRQLGGIFFFQQRCKINAALCKYGLPWQ